MHAKLRKGTVRKLGDYWLSCTVLIQSLLMLAQSLLGDSGVISIEFAASLRVLFSVLVVTGAMIWIFDRNLKISIAVYLFFISLFILSFFVSNDNYEYILSEGIRFTIPICIPIYLSIISISDEDIFKKTSIFISYLCAIISIIYTILFSTGNLPMIENYYNMSFGYALLLPTLFLIHFKKNKFLILILILSITIAGSRGPLVPIFLFIIYKICVYSSLKRKIFIFIFFIAGIIFIFPLIVHVFDFLEINSRTILLILDGSIDSDSGRDVIYNTVIDYILQNPLYGYGLFADRVFTGSYCHNIFLEMFLNFGIFIPLIIFAFFVFGVFLILPKMNKKEKDMFFLYFFSSILPLMVSGSYITDFRLPLFLGYFSFLLKRYTVFNKDKLTPDFYTKNLN